MNVSYTQILIILVLINQTATENISSENTDLELVQVLFRHGDRTPTKKSVFDKFNEKDWNKYGGYGQLTQKGMNTAFNLGAGLRKLYAEFISRIYNRNEIYVRSTDYDRTIMSAELVLAGLFEPTDYQIWNSKINWQPIPVHTTEQTKDDLFNHHGCPKYDHILNEKVFKSDQFLKQASDNEDLIKLINKNIGKDSNLKLADLERLSDSLYIQNEFGMELPAWTKEASGKSTVYERIRKLGRGLYYFFYKETEQARLVSGPVLNEMRSNIQKKLNDTKSQMKLYLLSAHDNYVAALVKLLDLKVEMYQPNYSSALILELRKSNDNKRYIRVLWKNNWNTEPVIFNEMSALKCGDKKLCPLDTFMKLSESLVVSDIKAACKLDQKEGSMVIVYVLGVITAGICLIITLNLFIYHMILRKKHSRYQYQLNLGENLNLMISDDDLYTNTDDELYSRNRLDASRQN